jgi:tight adherence protein C
MIEYINLILATVIVLLFILMMIKGKKYDYMLENLQDDTFQLKELYSVGFGWTDTISALSYHSTISEKIRSDIVLLYGAKFEEYYTRLYLAKIVTFAHLVIAALAVVGALVSGIMGLFMIIIGFVVGVFIAKTYIDEPKKNVADRAEDCVIEFPNLVTKLALLLNAGITLRESWYIAAGTETGALRDLMQDACDMMENGRSEYDAMYEFGNRSGSEEIRKFSMSVIQSIEKGNAELASSMMHQSKELWEIKKQKLLQKGEKAATKLIIPTSLMFLGVIIVVLSCVVTGLSL